MSAVELVGRRLELERLVEVVDGVRQSGAALLVRGEPGIGKSSLLDATADRARGQGYRVLAVTGVESEEGLAFAGLQLLLHPVMAAGRTLPQPQRKALAVAFGLEEGPPPQPFLLGLAALNLLGELASAKPVLVTVDDVQWLDGPTQEVLAFLARRIAGDPVVMIAAVRTGHHSPLLTAGLDVLGLHGLDDSSSQEVLAVVAADLSEVDRDRILRQAVGNPLALVELPTAWRAAGNAMAQLVPQLVPLSGRLERAFAVRLPELPPRTRDALLVAAVDADDELPEILAATSVLSGSPVDEAVLEPAVQAGLLTFDQAHLRFRHPLVKSGILQAESTTRRHAASAALADVLRDQPLRRTWYRAQATIGPDDEVADELAATHTENLRRGSVSAAISALERAAQLTRDSSLQGHRLLLAAELAFGLGHAPLVTRLLRAAAGHRLTELDQARMEWLRELPDATDFKSSRRLIELTEIAAKAATTDVDLALNLLVAAGVRCFWGWPDSDVRDRLVAVTESLTDAEADPRYLAVLAMAQPLLQGRRVETLLSRAAADGRTDPGWLLLCGMAGHAIGDQARAADFLTQAEATCRLEGRLGMLTQVLSMHSAVEMDLGHWRQASAAAEEGHQLATETRQSPWEGGLLADLSRIHGLRGDVALALDLAARLEVSAGLHRNTSYLACAALARGYALLNSGRHLEAYEVLVRLFDPGDPSYHEREQLTGLMFLAEAAAYAGRRNDVRPIIERLEETALLTPSPILHIHLHYARAVLADGDEAERLYVEGLKHDLSRWPWVKARLELGYGSWLRRQRRPSEARAHLRSAQATLEWIGADTWAERARSELRAAGERTAVAVGPPADRRQDLLTAQELQISRLAAEGLSNREIGDRLFMSHRTVGAHLRHIFTKLDIVSRVQLAALFQPGD